MGRGGVLAAVLLIACGQINPHTGSSSVSSSQARNSEPTAASTARLTPPAFASTARLTPPPTGAPQGPDLPLSAVTFNCRMPVARGQAVGFISFPSAHFDPDPTGGAVAFSDGYVNPIRRTTAQPYLLGAGRSLHLEGREASYDAVTTRWLPVPREFASPDGLRYVYITTIDLPAGPAPYVSKAHVVDAATGAERTYDLPGIPMIAVVVEFAADGVYLTSGWEGLPNGLWRLNPGDGSLGKVSDQPGTVAIRDGVLWTFYLRSGATYPTGYPVDTVRRSGLTGAGATDWFSPGVPIYPFGSDGQGRPLIAALSYLGADGRDHAYNVWQLSAPGQARKILGHWSGAQSLSDSHGIWLGTERGLYLYTEAAGLQKVAVDAVVPLGSCA